MGGVEDLAQVLSTGRVLVFTGVGVDGEGLTESDYGPEGLWQRVDPVVFDEFMASEETRVEYWKRKLTHYDELAGAKPNANYQAVATLQELGHVQAVVTQTVDGWHQVAGTQADKVIELHGSYRSVECISCHKVVEPADAIKEFQTWDIAPRCAVCSAPLKPATISYGQQMRPNALERALVEAGKADAVAVFGSPLSVVPAAAVTQAAARRGIPYAIVEPLDTDQDDLSTLRLYDEVIDVLPAAVALLSGRAGGAA